VLEDELALAAERRFTAHAHESALFEQTRIEGRAVQQLAHRALPERAADDGCRL
jgi:hypothetical protein